MVLEKYRQAFTGGKSSDFGKFYGNGDGSVQQAHALLQACRHSSRRHGFNLVYRVGMFALSFYSYGKNPIRKIKFSSSLENNLKLGYKK